MIGVEQSGGFKKIEAFFDNIFRRDLVRDLDKYGKAGVEALRQATPKDSGLTASSWVYEIDVGVGASTITWKNTNIQNGVSVAVLLQYGHATRNGGYVQGIDYVNPALKAVFDDLANDAWKEVTRY